jgi:hypothetical protein
VHVNQGQPVALCFRASLFLLAAAWFRASEPGLASAATIEPEPDSLSALSERLCSLAPPAAHLAGAYRDSAETHEGPARYPQPGLGKRLSVLAAELERLCRLYRAEGERLFPGQEVSAVYRRRRAVERALARTAPPPELEDQWAVLQGDLLRLHRAVDWRAFNAWYLERDGDSD